MNFTNIPVNYITDTNIYLNSTIVVTIQSYPGSSGLYMLYERHTCQFKQYDVIKLFDFL